MLGLSFTGNAEQNQTAAACTNCDTMSSNAYHYALRDGMSSYDASIYSSGIFWGCIDSGDAQRIQPLFLIK